MLAAADILSVGAGGAFGAIARYALQQAAVSDAEKICHTAAINLAGCLAIGIVWALLTHTNAPAWISRMLIAGFLGGFTTFSAFALDTVSLLCSDRLWNAAAYMGTSVAGGVLLCGFGLFATNRILSLIS